MASYEKYLKSRSTTRDARRTSRSSRKGGGGGFSDRFAPPKEDDGDPQAIVLFPGDYKMKVTVGKKGKKTEEMERKYYLVFEHGRKTKEGWRSVTCRAGLKLEQVEKGVHELTYGDNQCGPCFHIDDGSAGINRRLLHVFNLVSLGYYHLIDSDREDSEGKPYKEWAECAGKRCKHCNDESERVYGRRMYWPLGKRHIGQLLSYAEKELAANCKCGGELSIVGFQCSECNEILLDLEEDPVDKKELAQLRNRPMKCPNCKEKEIPDAVTECDSCREPQPLTLWDVRLKVLRTGTGTDTSLMVTGFKIISDKLRRNIEKRMRPFDFESSIYRLPSTEQQAKRLDIPNPFDDDDNDDERGGVKWDDDED
jgi:hypothetical protein